MTREAVQKKYYAAIKKGEFDKAEKLLAKMVDMDVASLAKKLEARPEK